MKKLIIFAYLFSLFLMLILLSKQYSFYFQAENIMSKFYILYILIAMLLINSKKRERKKERERERERGRFQI